MLSSILILSRNGSKRRVLADGGGTRCEPSPPRFKGGRALAHLVITNHRACVTIGAAAAVAQVGAPRAPAGDRESVGRGRAQQGLGPALHLARLAGRESQRSNQNSPASTHLTFAPAPEQMAAAHEELRWPTSALSTSARRACRTSTTTEYIPRAVSNGLPFRAICTPARSAGSSGLTSTTIVCLPVSVTSQTWSSS